MRRLLAAALSLAIGFSGAAEAQFGPIVSPPPTAVLNAQFFGAKCDGVTNDAPALQAAIASSIAANGVPVYLPAFCAISTTLSITGYVQIIGNGRNSGLIPATSIDAIDINTQNAVILKNFSINYPSAAANTTQAINITAGASAENIGTVIDNLHIAFPFIGINAVKASAYTFTRNDIESWGGNGIQISNTNNADSGDGTVSFNRFGGNATQVGSCVYWQSAGGLKFIGNKCLSAVDGFNIALASGAATGEILINSNSIENITDACVKAARQGATGSFHQLIVNDNECYTLGSASQTYDLYIPSDANGVWLTAVSMIGGTYYSTSTATNNIMADIFSANGFTSNGLTMIPSAGATNNYRYVINASVSNGAIGPTVCAGTCTTSLNSGTGVTAIAPN